MQGLGSRLRSGSVYTGRVLAVDGVDAEGKGAASGITYDIEVSNGTNTFLVLGVAPTMPRYPDIIDVMAAPAGSPVQVQYTGDRFRFQVTELPVITECPN